MLEITFPEVWQRRFRGIHAYIIAAVFKGMLIEELLASPNLARCIIYINMSTLHRRCESQTAQSSFISNSAGNLRSIEYLLFQVTSYDILSVTIRNCKSRRLKSQSVRHFETPLGHLGGCGQTRGILIRSNQLSLVVCTFLFRNLMRVACSPRHLVAACGATRLANRK